MNWLHRLPLRYLLPILLGGFAAIVSGLAHLNTRPAVYENVERQAVARMRATLAGTQGALELLWRTGHFGGMKSLIATFGAERGQTVTALVGADGVILASTSLREVGQSAANIYSALDPALLDRIKTTGGTSVSLSPDKTSIAGYARVCGPDLTSLRTRECGFFYHEKSLIHETAEAVLLLRAQAIKSVLAIALLTLLFLWLLHLLLTRRAQRLVAGARAFASGDTTVRTGLDGGDEFAEVGRAFDSMLDTVVEDQAKRKLAEDALRESHDLLEQRVLQRTSQLRESEERYRELFENADDLIQSVRSDGSFMYVNPAWRRTLGYSEEEIDGLTLFQIIHPDDHAHCRTIFDRLVSGQSVERIEARFVTKSGEDVLVEGNASCRFKDGSPVATRAIFHDVTRHAEAERSLQDAKEAAESAANTKSRFLAAASHDLRQPLQSLGLYLSVLERRLEQPRQKEISAKIRKSLDTMAELLDALLDISKLDGGSITLEKRDFRIQELLDRIVTDNIQQAEKKGLHLICTSADCVVHTDPGLLERVIENFVTNAIRYTERGRVSIDCQCSGDTARIAVTDTGIGIAKHDLDKVFEEYYQLDNPVRDKRKGLGLGLSIVKHIALLLDHPLDVTSVPGEGSTFAVEVPVGRAEVERVQPRAPAKAPARVDREPIVLLVDDDPAIVDATTMLLRSAGVQVHSASSGGDALAQIKAGMRPDLVVSDYRLPGYSGVEVIQRVRQATVDDLPAVLMTGDTSAHEAETAKLSNCTILHKPVDTDRLLSVIEDLTGNRTLVNA